MTAKTVSDYLAVLRWDGVRRIDRWLVDYAGAEDSPYVRRVSRAVLIAAVRRARYPGCQLDEMLILEGPQGCGKTSALRILAINEDWFLDRAPIGAAPWEIVEATAGKWFVEAAELHCMSGPDIGPLKAFLSSREEGRDLTYQPELRVPRQFVVVGTTSQGEYLKDATGNRRFWPVRVEHFKLENLRADRDQLWAEAAEAEALGESIHLDSRLSEASEVEQETRLSGDDPILDVLHRVIGNRTGKLRVSDAYLICGIEPSKANQDQINRFGKAIRELGWERQRRRFDGSLQYVYVKGTPTEREVDLGAVVAEQRHAYVVLNSQFGVEFSGESLDAACTYVDGRLREQAMTTTLANPSSYRIQRVKAG